MTYQEISVKICAMLENADFENAAVEAENLIIEILDITRSEFSIRKIMRTQLSEDEEKTLLAAAEKLALPYPLQYITGRAYFRDLVLNVSPGVLIPRFETEILVDCALKEIPENGKMLDVGTGSGAIAIACASERKDISVLAVDISEKALDIAKKNAEKYELQNISFRHSDLFSEISADEKFDVIAANLPYVTCDEYETLHRQVKDWEPQLALTADDCGMALIKKACLGLSEVLTSGGYAIFEMSPWQTSHIQILLEELGFQTGIIKDYTGRNRFVSAKKK